MQAIVSRSELATAELLQAGEWITPFLALYVNDVAANPNRPLDEFVLASFAGSAQKAVLAPVVADDIPGPGILFPLLPALFTCTAAPDPLQTVYGFIIYDTGDANRIIAAFKLLEAVVIGAIGDHVYIDPELWVKL